MRFDTLLLASLPSALGLQLAYAPPPELMAKANAADNNCVLPASYMVQNFVGTSNDTGNSLGSFDFRFVDSETQITTRCHFNSSSKSTTPGSLTPRYACENGEVKFIWEDEDGDLTMVERVCPGSDDKADYEVSGSIHLQLVCGLGGSCFTNATSHEVRFTSLSPVRDPTMV